MAQSTPKSLRNLVIYEIYVRNHGRFGKFSDISADLPRLREMGIDVIWFMPIHPIGQLNKKGTLGCPYSIQDYRQVNPAYGNQKEFRLMCEYAHALGLKVMIDVVYNHTAHDSVLVQEHPAWFHQDENGKPVTTVPEWSDVIDLRYDDPALWDYLIETLKFWVGMGVDGFRCDVASVVPLAFWQQARAAVAEIKPDTIWLAESVHTQFVLQRRQHGLTAHADGEIHTAFDLSYDYDIWPTWERAVENPAAVPLYFSMLQYQQGIYPAHTLKMRCVENHDQPRIMQRAPSRAQALAWTAFQAFNEGAFLIYAGQESENRHTPSLFEEDKVIWRDYSLQGFLTKLCKLKKDPVQVEGDFRLITADPALTAHWQAEHEGLYGAFNVAGVVDVMSTPLPAGQYLDLLSEREVTVREGKMMVPETAVILRYSGQLDTEAHRQPALLL
ncbi:MAG: alpha-amylase [Chloroflexi bacterium]|nr:MAG: alpha-amylase [Chloroflexota bacterium]